MATHDDANRKPEFGCGGCAVELVIGTAILGGAAGIIGDRDVATTIVLFVVGGCARLVAAFVVMVAGTIALRFAAGPSLPVPSG